MLGYHKPGEDLQVGFPGRYATERFTEMIVRVFKTYIPSVRTGVCEVLLYYTIRSIN